MDNRIVRTLEELEQRSQLEKSHKIDVEPQNRMLAITKETGQFFNILLHSKNAKNVLEIGTSVGYSTIWCAEAIMKNAGKIITIEKNQDKIARAKNNFKDAGVTKFIEIQHGNALDVLSELNRNQNYQEFFDFVLIDADKENVIKYFQMTLSLVKINGVIVTDNMLYPEKYRETMKRYSKNIRQFPNIMSVLVPIGNGEEVTVKLR